MVSHSLFPLAEYDQVIVSFSGGKDCTASLLHLLEEGVDPDRIELWHQNVDGEPGGPRFMDWPCTDGYVRAFGAAMGITALFQWREGGFRGEMLRTDAPTGDVSFQTLGGDVVRLPSNPDRRGTRNKFPMRCNDLSKRWCSPSLKIDVFARAINNDRRFLRTRTLVVTGERGEESTKRAGYEEHEPHRCHRRKRHVDHYRPVLRWPEKEVWGIIRRHRIRVHPAYYLAFGRVSCMKCIFLNADQWATLRVLDPEGFAQVAGLEVSLGSTVIHGKTLGMMADRGTSTLTPSMERYRTLAMATEYPASMIKFGEGEQWVLPAGAYKRCGGPT